MSRRRTRGRLHWWYRGTVAVVGSLLVPAVLAAGMQPAAAVPSPSVPSADQVQRARSAADAKAAQVSAVQAALIVASARLEAARVAAERAAEDYDSTQIKVAVADQAAQLAGRNATGATAGYQRARVEVARIAAQTYRNGGNLSLVGVLLEPGGPQDMLDRSAMLDNLGAERSRAMQRMDAARVVAVLLQEQADDAARQQRAASAALAAARERAQAAADAAAATVAATEAQQDRLLAQLAALRKTSVALERQRQVALAAEADRRNRPAGATSGSGADGAGSGAGSGQAGSGSASGGSSGSGQGRRAPSPGSSRGSASAGQVAVAWARQQLGLPYQWGGAGPNGYDCSGLTMRAWQQAGVALPHYAASQYERSRRVSYDQMRPGDLIFYAANTSDPATIHHVTMYVGDGHMIEAPFSGASVRVVAVRWNRTMPWAGRP